MDLGIAYKYGVDSALEKLALTDTAVTAGTAFVSPLASGLTAEEGKGLQTSLGGIAGSLLGKKLFKNNLAGRLLGSAGATGASNVGAGLVSPDPEVIKEMKRRGEFSKWDYMTRGMRAAGTGALIGGGLASGAGIPAALVGAGAGAGRGAFSGYVASPLIRSIMQNIKERPEMAKHPAIVKTIDTMKKMDKPEVEGAVANVMPIARHLTGEEE